MRDSITCRSNDRPVRADCCRIRREWPSKINAIFATSATVSQPPSRNQLCRAFLAFLQTVRIHTRRIVRERAIQKQICVQPCARRICQNPEESFRDVFAEEFTARKLALSPESESSSLAERGASGSGVSNMDSGASEESSAGLFRNRFQPSGQMDRSTGHQGLETDELVERLGRN